MFTLLDTETDTFDLLAEMLSDRMGVQPILPIKVSVTFGTMLTFEGDFDGQGDGTDPRQHHLCIRVHFRLV